MMGTRKLFILFFTGLHILVLSQNFLEKKDLYTNEFTSYQEIFSLQNGKKISQADCDGVIIICQKEQFYRRILPLNGYCNVKWFGVKGDGDKNDNGSDDTANIERAIQILTKIFPVYSLSGDNNFGGFTLFFPAGKYITNKTFILPDNINVTGESSETTDIHATTPHFIFTNIRGFASNKTDMLMSSNIKIQNITLTQGGIELQGATDSVVENVRLLNLFGEKTSTGLLIKLSVNLKIKNVKIFGSTGTGIIYEDTAGSGPSTTVTFENLWISHCNNGMTVDGLSNGSHAIIASKIYNSIFEYNNTGLQLKGNIENFAVRDCHFEQNNNGGIIISGQVTANFDNVWSDVDKILATSESSKKSKILLLNTKMRYDNSNFIFEK